MSDAAGRESETYWTIKTSDAPPPPEWGVPQNYRAPHSKICCFQYGTLATLVKKMEENGSNRRALVNLARVRMLENGFRVEFFPTLAAARAAEKESRAILGK